MGVASTLRHSNYPAALVELELDLSFAVEVDESLFQAEVGF